MQIKKRIIIKGNVHDVGYRLHLLQKAEELLIPNIGVWNEHEDGREVVRVLVGGKEEQVKRFLNFVKENIPTEARVEGTPSVEDYKGEISSIEAFSRSFSTSQLAKIANAGVGMLKMQRQTIEKLDSFHQDTVHRFDNLDVKYGRIADNMEKILKEMKEERKDFRESIEKILKILISQKSK